jgi:hypothetical protein
MHRKSELESESESKTESEIERETESEIEREIETSKSHWSEVPLRCDSAQKAKNEAIFDTLRRKYPLFPWHVKNLPIDDMKLIGEGGQAKIFEDISGKKVVYKVFKHGSSLQDLQKQWPVDMFDNLHMLSSCVCVVEANLSEDGTFAFSNGQILE